MLFEWIVSVKNILPYIFML